MKKRILLIIAAIMLLAAVGVVAFAADPEPTPEMSIEYNALSYRDAICLKYAVKSNVEDIQLLVWMATEDDYNVTNADIVLDDVGYQVISEVKHWIFDLTGITAKQMTDEFYARPYCNVGGVDYYGDVKKYSVLEQAFSLQNSALSDPAEVVTVTKMLEYGAAVQEMLGYNTAHLANAKYYMVNVVGGTLSDGFDHALFIENENITLNAPATDADGNVFDHWENSSAVNVGDTSELIIPAAAKNETYTAVYVDSAPAYSEGLGFYLLEDDTYSLTGRGECEDKDIIVPPTYQGKPVTTIGSQAFNYSSITSIVIPDSIISIGNHAFDNCTQLTTVTIGENSNLTTIGEYAFNNCSAIESIYIPTSVTNLEYDAFVGCSGIKKVLISDLASWLNITVANATANPIEYSKNLYLNGELLTELVIPDNIGITRIKKYSFRSCQSFESIVIPDGVEVIDYEAFRLCSNLKSITIPDSILYIADYAFMNCDSITDIYFGGTQSEWNDITKAYYWISSSASYNVHYAETETETIEKLSYKYLSDDTYEVIGIGTITSTDIVIPSTHNGRPVVSIAENAFLFNGSITSVTIGDNVKKIGNQAFYYCTALESVTIGSSVTYIGQWVFKKCSRLTSFIFEDTTNWYHTQSSNHNYTGGTLIDVTDPTANATNLVSSNDYWYKG